MRHFIKLIFCLSLLTVVLSARAADTLQVNLVGVPSNITGTVKNSLSLVQYPKYALSAAIKMQSTFQQGIKQIKLALQNYGYFRAKVHGEIHYNAAAKTWVATYTVKPGPLLKITQSDIKIIGPGAKDYAFQDLVHQSKVKVGDALIKKNYDDFKDNLQNVASDLGFFDAQLVKHQVIVNIDAYTAKVIIQLNTGVRYRFGTVTFNQKPDKLNDSFLRRFLAFKTGWHYNQTRVNWLQQDLNNSNYFTTVNVVPKPDKKTKTVPVNVTLIPHKPFQYSVGLGYGTDTGLRGMLGWKWRFVTRSGQYIHASTQISRIYQIYTVSYVIPGEKPLWDYTTLDVASNDTDVSSYSANQRIFGINFTRRYYRWQFKYGIDQHYILHPY